MPYEFRNAFLYPQQPSPAQQDQFQKTHGKNQDHIRFQTQLTYKE